MQNHWLLLGAVLLLGAIDVTSSYRVWQLAAANGRFAYDMYRTVVSEANGDNVFFSPFRCVLQLRRIALCYSHGGLLPINWSPSLPVNSCVSPLFVSRQSSSVPPSLIFTTQMGCPFLLLVCSPLPTLVVCNIISNWFLNTNRFLFKFDEKYTIINV